MSVALDPQWATLQALSELGRPDLPSLWVGYLHGGTIPLFPLPLCAEHAHELEVYLLQRLRHAH